MSDEISDIEPDICDFCGRAVGTTYQVYPDDDSLNFCEECIEEHEARRALIKKLMTEPNALEQSPFPVKTWSVINVICPHCRKVHQVKHAKWEAPEDE